MQKPKLIEEYNRMMIEGGFKTLNKSAFKFSNNAVKFLNGLTTNDMNKDANAFPDRLGKLIVLADQKAAGDEVYIVIEEKFEERFLEHIGHFIKISKTKMEKLNLKAVHIIGGSNDNTRNFKKNENIIIGKNIGFIALLKDNELNLLENMKAIPDEVYEAIRIENNIPVQGIDFDSVMFLETGLDGAVSYSKGCYLGQEIIARVHYKGKPARKLVRILYDKLPEGDNVKIGGEIAGKITSRCFSPKYNKHLAFAMISYHENNADEGKLLK